MEELDKDVDKMLSDKLMITLHEKFKSRAAGITEGVSAWNTTDGIVRTIVLLKRIPSWEKLSYKELEATIDKAEKRMKGLIENLESDLEDLEDKYKTFKNCY